jgi:CRISPR/Cas system CMR subunit Cmr6 (Cas7 group RAMP superfamily)
MNCWRSSDKVVIFVLQKYYKEDPSKTKGPRANPNPILFLLIAKLIAVSKRFQAPVFDSFPA